MLNASTVVCKGAVAEVAPIAEVVWVAHIIRFVRGLVVGVICHC